MTQNHLQNHSCSAAATPIEVTLFRHDSIFSQYKGIGASKEQVIHNFTNQICTICNAPFTCM